MDSCTISSYLVKIILFVAFLYILMNCFFGAIYFFFFLHEQILSPSKCYISLVHGFMNSHDYHYGYYSLLILTHIGSFPCLVVCVISYFIQHFHVLEFSKVKEIISTNIILYMTTKAGGKKIRVDT